jgi:hypothetical protein
LTGNASEPAGTGVPFIYANGTKASNNRSGSTDPPVATASNPNTTSGAATLNAEKGTITTHTDVNVAAGMDYTLTLTNSLVHSTLSNIYVTLDDGTNTTAPIYVRKVTPFNGSATILIRNGHASSALNGSIKIRFTVVN